MKTKGATAESAEEVIVLGAASVETLGDVGLWEFEGGPPMSGISED